MKQSLKTKDMKTLDKIMKSSILTGCMTALVCGLLFTGCQDEIDKSAIYTFTGKTVADILEDDPEFSDYYELTQMIMPTIVSESPVSKLLSARGHYSCFAPTNEALQTYLTKLHNDGVIDVPVTKAYDIADEVVRDSIMKVIVLNSIIDCGNDNEAYETVDFQNETTLPLPNMNDRLLRTDISAENGQTVYTIARTCRILQRDIEATNGYVQKMENVIAPTNSNLTDMMLNTPNMKVFNSFIEKTGFNEKLTVYRDQEYEDKYLKNEIEHDLGKLLGAEDHAITPEHRNIGFTIFAETDDVFGALGIDDEEKLIKYLVDNGYYTSYDTRLAEEGGDYKSPNHILYQFVAYHILPMAIPHDRLVIHNNELHHQPGVGTPITIPVFEYYTTMSENPRRLMKLTHGKKTNGIRINRYTEMYTSVEEDPDPTSYGYEENVNENTIPGILVNSSNALADGQTYDNEAINGYIYPIDEILAYDEDNMKGKVLNERIRFDIASCLPELMTNNFRGIKGDLSGGSRIRGFATTYPYFGDNMTWTATTKVQYLPGWKRGGYFNYQADEFNIMGRYDVTMKLPAIPYDGTFEVRYYMSVNAKRGLAQVYFGEKNNIKAMGIPLDLRMGGKSMAGNSSIISPAGWVDDDPNNPEYNDLIDKTMRNNGYMKGPNYFGEANDPSSPVRTKELRIRQILFTARMERNKTYYIRFKSVLEKEDSEFYYDFLELVPSNIYNNPEKKEDIW